MASALSANDCLAHSRACMPRLHFCSRHTPLSRQHSSLSVRLLGLRVLVFVLRIARMSFVVSRRVGACAVGRPLVSNWRGPEKGANTNEGETKWDKLPWMRKQCQLCLFAFCINIVPILALGAK